MIELKQVLDKCNSTTMFDDWSYVAIRFDHLKEFCGGLDAAFSWWKETSLLSTAARTMARFLYLTSRWMGSSTPNNSIRFAQMGSVLKRF
jgi:hypothetical protein